MHSCHTFRALLSLFFFCYLLLSYFATCHHSVVAKLVTTRLLCNLAPLSCCATCHHLFVLQLVTTQPFCDLVTTQLFHNLSPLSFFCDFPLGCCLSCPSVVMQLVTTRLFSNLLPLSCSETCHRSVPRFITTHLFRNLSQLGCCQLVTMHLFCNWSPLSRSATYHSFGFQLAAQLLCNS